MFMRLISIFLLLVSFAAPPLWARDLAEIRQDGVLRHLGVRYANFITGGGDGLEVELMQSFARHLGVRYQFVETTWPHIIPDLIGKDAPETQQSRGPRGDIIASGFTVLPERAKLLEYGTVTFPTAVWLVARADVKVKPIQATGNLQKDIEATKERMKKGSILTMPHTCLDPKLYRLENRGFRLVTYTRSSNLNEMVPTILNREADMSLLDVPDILLALQKWPGQIKVIGPVSETQTMAPAFRKSSPELRQAFNEFFVGMLKDGSYQRLVRKYYPSLQAYFPDFFAAPNKP